MHLKRCGCSSHSEIGNNSSEPSSHQVVTEISGCTGGTRKESQEPREASVATHAWTSSTTPEALWPSQCFGLFRPHMDQISPFGCNNSWVYLPQNCGKSQRSCQPDLTLQGKDRSPQAPGELQSQPEKRCLGLQAAGCWWKAAWVMASGHGCHCSHCNVAGSHWLKCDRENLS